MKLTVRLFAMAAAICVSLSLHAQSTGDLSFVDICADGPDAFTLVALEEIPANRTIYLRDDEWNGTTWADANEGFITWSTGASPIARGTIISFSGVTDGQTLTVNIGTAVAGGNRGLGAGDESIFCYTGTDANTPTAFICAIGKGTLNAAFGSLSGTGLTQGTTAILFPTTLDIAAYNGPRTGLTKAGYVAALNTVANYQTQDGSGDQNADGTAPDLPFSLTAFTILANPSIGFRPVVQWVGESRDSADIVIELTGANPAGVSFRLQLNSWGTATAGTDLQTYVKDTSFAAGVTGTITLRVDVTDDASAETDEYAVFELTNVTGANIVNGAYHTLHLVDNDVAAPTASGELQLSLLTSLRNGSSGTNSAEIVAYDKNTRRLWVVNSIAGKINIYNFSNPAAPVLFTTVDILPLGGINSVAIQNGVIAAAIENTNKLLPGQVVFFDADGNVLKQINAGVLPDMLAISPDGKYVVTADEAEPATDYLTDPEGSVTVIDISGGIAGLTQANATTISLASLNPLKSSLRAAGVRLFGRFGNVADGSSVAQDLEPEYVSFSPDSKLAYVTCQENNAVLVIDLDAKAIAQQAGNPLLLPLGLKDHSLPGNGLDASDRADSINIARWRVKGMYMPDAIATIQSSKGTFYITANEGDAREYSALTEEVQLSALRLNPANFPDSVVLRQQGNLGRINITNQSGDLDNDGRMDELHVLGSRSVTIWDANGNRVWDSGEDLERIVRANTRAFFNANNSTGNPSIKNRSDNKGPEPEGVAIGTVCGKIFAFVTLERSGGVVVYDVTDPQAPVFVTYANNRTSPAAPSLNDLGPEGILFIPSTESPNGRDLVLLANEISSSVSVYEITCNNTLPIVLQQFGAHLRGADAVLHWQVASADDVRHFVVEYSRDGRQYRPLAQVAPAGRQYEYVHAQLPAGNHYYRLLMADKDGGSRYSRTVLLQKGQAASAIVGLQQNPVQSTATVVLASQQPQRGQLRISDATGRILVQAVRQLPAGTQQWPVSVASLPAGYYYLQVSLADGSTANLPFVKQ